MRKTRIWLFCVTVLLICIGIVMIYSASSVYAWQYYGDSTRFLKRHIAFLFIGVAFSFLVMGLDYHRLKRYAKPMMVLAFALLVLVLIPGIGREVSGARRWFRFGVFSFQPSEFVNIATVIYIADFISRKRAVFMDFYKGFLPTMAVLGAAALLILLQPDLGSAIALCLIVFIMLFVSGIRLSYLASVLLLSIPVLCLIIFSVPYRRQRIITFLNPWADPQASGFQIIQSQIALGSGGIFGVGLGHSKQKLFYLPAAHTDFIFSIIGEETGLIGTTLVVALFIIFLLAGLKIIKNAPDRFGNLLGVGIVSMIILKAAVNIGVSLGALPTKGLPLPFISYGGSSLIFDMIGVGILLNISRAGEYR